MEFDWELTEVVTYKFMQFGRLVEMGKSKKTQHLIWLTTTFFTMVIGQHNGLARSHSF
jgi:hypothetical protein